MAVTEKPPTVALPRRFWPYLTSRVVSIAGDGAALAALAILVYQRHPTALAVAGLFVARVLPRLAGPFTGHLADRVELRRLMRLCDTGSAVLFGLIAWLGPPYVALLVLVFLAELCAATAVPATRTAVTRIVPKELLGRANAWLATALALSLTVGAGVGGLLVATVGAPAALAVNAGSFALAVAFSVAVPAMPAAPREPGAGRALGTVRANMVRLWTIREARLVVVGLVVVLFSASLDRPALVFLTQSVLRVGPAGYGLTTATIGLGVLVSGLLVRSGVLKLTATFFVAAIALQGIAHIAMGLAPDLAFLAGALLVAGVGNGLESVAGMTLLQLAVPRESVGGSMGVVMSAMYLADAVGSVVAGGLLTVLAPRVVFVVAGSLLLTGAVAVGAATRGRNNQVRSVRAGGTGLG